VLIRTPMNIVTNVFATIIAVVGKHHPEDHSSLGESRNCL
jgi:hypothetical protein